MAISIVKESIELESVTTDADGNAWLTKRINLKDGYRHLLHQVDIYQDRYPRFVDGGQTANVEFVVSTYPSIPTNMDFAPSATGGTQSYPAGADDSVLFKAHTQVYNVEAISSGVVRNVEQFPSEQIAANNEAYFYSDHVYINMCIKSGADSTFENVAYSFLLVLDDKKVANLENSLGILAEQHNAMCALVMSNGRMVSVDTLRGNTFPMWRYGGIRPEHTITPTAANTFFLEIDTRDAETMVNTTQIRQSVADARQMSPFDQAMGDRRPDWLTIGLNQGIVAGPVRADPVPLKYADNGNTRMF